MAKDTEKTAPAPEPVVGTEKDTGLVEVEFLRPYFIGEPGQPKRLVRVGERAFVRRESLKAIEHGKPPYGRRVK